MQLIIHDTKLESVQQVRQFMEGNEIVEFRGLTAEEKRNAPRFDWRDEYGIVRPLERRAGAG